MHQLLSMQQLKGAQQKCCVYAVVMDAQSNNQYQIMYQYLLLKIYEMNDELALHQALMRNV